MSRGHQGTTEDNILKTGVDCWVTPHLKMTLDRFKSVENGSKTMKKHPKNGNRLVFRHFWDTQAHMWSKYTKSEACRFFSGNHIYRDFSHRGTRIRAFPGL
jgi:hypothetical protein